VIRLAGDDEKSQRRKDDLDLECRELAINTYQPEVKVHPSNKNRQLETSLTNHNSKF
jgi:hypothetical protein